MSKQVATRARRWSPAWSRLSAAGRPLVLRSRSRVLLGLVLVLSLTAAVALTSSTAGAPADEQPGGVPSRASGVYVGPCATTDLQRFSRWRGAQVEAVVDTLDVRTWGDLASPDFWVDCWGREQPMVYGVALVTEEGGSLQEGARGAYDDVFRSMGRTLIEGGQGSAWFRLGFEFNGAWFPWTAKDDPAAFAAYYRRVVDVLRTLPGEDFSFVWNPTVGAEEFPAEQAWPGPDYVDAIGLDLYDVSFADGTYPLPAGASGTEVEARRRAAWQHYTTMDHGLDWWVRYAERQDKPIAVPEWGLVERDRNGGGDNAYFVRQIHDWAVRNDVRFEAYFNAAGLLGDHDLRSGRFPEAARAYRDLFGGER